MQFPWNVRLAKRQEEHGVDLLQLKDEELLARLAEGDDSTLDVLYDRYAATLLALAMRVVGERTVAEEVVQETFVRVWRQARSYTATKGRFAGWIFSIAHNLAIDELRRRRSRPVAAETTERNGGDGEREAIKEIVDEGTDVADEAWQTIRGDLIRKEINLLPAAQREVIELAYFNGLTHTEIAGRLDQPLGTVKTRLLLGLRKLRDQLYAQGLDQGSL